MSSLLELIKRFIWLFVQMASILSWKQNPHTTALLILTVRITAVVSDFMLRFCYLWFLFTAIRWAFDSPGGSDPADEPGGAGAWIQGTSIFIVFAFCADNQFLRTDSDKNLAVPKLSSGKVPLSHLNRIKHVWLPPTPNIQHTVSPWMISLSPVRPPMIRALLALNRRGFRLYAVK